MLPAPERTFWLGGSTRLPSVIAAREPEPVTSLKTMSKHIYVELREAVHKSGGSTRTKDERGKFGKMFIHTQIKELNNQITSFKNLKEKQVHDYMQCRLKNGVALRTLQNEMAHLREILRALGRHQFTMSPRLSNKAVGIAGASRAGTHRALTDKQYRLALAISKVLNPGAACCIQLQRELGLRAQEAICSVKSLSHWLKALQIGRSVLVLHGTKGGRPRILAPVDVPRAIRAVELAISLAEAQGGRLISSRRLKSARSAYMAHCSRIGLRGEYASHSLRCMYAHDRFLAHVDALEDRGEALAATSMDLGHGDGRGRYIAQVYIRNQPREVPLDVAIDLFQLINQRKAEIMTNQYQLKIDVLSQKREKIREERDAECKKIDVKIRELKKRAEESTREEANRMIIESGLFDLENKDLQEILVELKRMTDSARNGGVRK